MGKRRNKNKIDREERAVFSSSSSNARKTNVTEVETSDVSDDESCVTHLTLDADVHSLADDDDDILSDTLTLSDRLGEFIGNATHKNISIRLAALDNIIALLTQQCIVMDLEKWTTTLIDIIDKALRKPDEEAIRGALLSALLSIQLGEKVSDDMEAVVNFLRQLCLDPARTVQIRTQCVRSVALCTFLSLEQPTSILASADALRSIWFGTKWNAVSVALFCAAVSGWSLLIYQGGREALRIALMDEPKLSTFVSGTQLEMRLSAGEALAVLHEVAVSIYGDDYRFPNQDHLLDIFATLTTDSLKFRAKKDRRIQRFTFRQMYASIKDQEAPEFTIKFGNETLRIDCFGKKLLYEFACGVLHGGINAHLRTNMVLREWFNLGPVIEIPVPVKMDKSQRVAIQNAINKTRDLKRSKQRGKRIAN